MDQSIGVRATPCTVQSASGGLTTLFAFSNLPAQTISAGVWSFTMYWNGGSGNTLDAVTVSAGVTALPTCVGFTATIPNGGTTWTTTYGGSGINTTSPLTVNTSAAQAALTIHA